MSTDHSGSVYLQNDWGVDIARLTIRHRRSNDPDKQEEQSFYNVAAGAKVGPMAITYTTGAGSPFDYWWVKFATQNGTTFDCKDNFYCSISSDDDGTVTLRLDGSNSDLYVNFSSSSGCSVSIDQVQG